MLDSLLQETWCHLPPFVNRHTAPPSVPVPVPPHQWNRHNSPPSLLLLVCIKSFSPSPALFFVFPPFQPGQYQYFLSYFLIPVVASTTTKWIEENSESVTWRNSKPWVTHTILVTLPILSNFIKKMGQFKCNKFVQVIDQSQPGVFYLQKWWISWNQGSFTFKKWWISWNQGCFTFKKWWISWKCALFIKKLPLFIKNSILHTYKKLKPQIWAL